VNQTVNVIYVVNIMVTEVPLGSSVTVVMTGLTLNVLVLVMNSYKMSICVIYVHHVKCFILGTCVS
jgi:hypothetical protein